MNSTTDSKIRTLIDRALEAPIVTSFTKVGYEARSRLDHWTPLSAYDLTGKVVLVTGATSGLGFSASKALAELGAHVVLLGRNADKTELVRKQLVNSTGNENITVVIADMGDLSAVRAVAADVLARHDRLDVLIHNAGALSAGRQVSPDGIEATVASQVVGPFLLTSLLLGRLQASAPARVITMSSGGMYATGLTIDHLEMGDDYRGSEQYARAKRAQVTLNEMWAARFPDRRVVFHAVHPGWADTPGVEESLPTFRRIVGPLLRSPEQGADTLVWLAVDGDEPLATTGKFWLDRRTRPIHKLPTTRRTDTPAQRDELWRWCVQRSGIDPDDRR